MILVTGGAGYIGSHFVHHYLSRYPGTEVLVVDDFSYGHQEALEGLEGARLLNENIGDQKTMIDIFKQYSIDAVVHFAAYCLVGESQENPAKYFQNNVVNSLNLFEAMQAADVKNIVFSSSCATYGMPKHIPINEEHPQDPINVYGMTKLMIEEALTAYAFSCGWSYFALRYFNAAGANKDGTKGESHNPETHLIPLVLQAASGKRDYVQINGNDYDTKDGTCVRDYVHIEDLANAHCLALEYVKENRVSQAINLGTAHGASVKQIIDLCSTITGKKINTKIGPKRPGDPAALVADYQKAKEVLGWEPKHDLQSIITSAWQWEQNRKY